MGYNLFLTSNTIFIKGRNPGAFLIVGRTKL